jgi:type IV secretory pathway VirB2 component (pilin)
VLAVIRPDSWNLPLFLHVLGGMVLVGVLVAGAVALLAARRQEHATRLRRFAFRLLLFAGLPAYIAMFVSGEWMSSKEGLGGEDDPAWFIVGILVGDLAGLLLVVSIVLAALASWKSKARLGRAAGAVVAVALLLCLVGVWAMTIKPS